MKYLILPLLVACTPGIPGARSARDVAQGTTAEVLALWSALGREDPPQRCVDWLDELQYAVVDDDAFVVACGRCAAGAPADECSTERYAPAWACFVTPGGAPTAVISDRRPADQIPRLLVHEGTHALQQCTGTPFFEEGLP